MTKLVERCCLILALLFGSIVPIVFHTAFPTLVSSTKQDKGDVGTSQSSLNSSHKDEYCGESNYFPERKEGAIRPQDLVPHHSKTCSSVQEFLDAVKFGERHWDDPSQVKNMSWIEKEKLPSTFSPHGCDIPVLAPERMCAIMNKFSHVTILGDSLSRNVQGGLIVGLKNDFVKGRVETCRCDGQVGDKLCPSFKNGTFNHFSPQQEGFCPLLNETNEQLVQLTHQFIAYSGYPQGYFQFPEVDCATSSRGLLLILQGGLHFRTDPLHTLDHFGSILSHSAVRTCAKHKKLTLIWSSFNSQSPRMDKKYPHQSRKKGLMFNKKVKGLFRMLDVNATIIDWMNFTRGAQSPDGVHYWMNTNFFKSQHLLTLADMMLEEGMFSHVP
jgi:hypothetical protein